MSQKSFHIPVSCSSLRSPSHWPHASCPHFLSPFSGNPDGSWSASHARFSHWYAWQWYGSCKKVTNIYLSDNSLRPQSLHEWIHHTSLEDFRFIKESALCTSFIITLTHSDMVNTYACCELMYVLQGWPQPKVWWHNLNQNLTNDIRCICIIKRGWLIGIKISPIRQICNKNSGA